LSEAQGSWGLTGRDVQGLLVNIVGASCKEGLVGKSAYLFIQAVMQSLARARRFWRILSFKKGSQRDSK